MSTGYKFGIFFFLLFLAFAAVLSRPHWLTKHGRATCNGLEIPGVAEYRSERGEIFVFGAEVQPAVIAPQSNELGRCNAPAFTRVFGLVFSREAEASVQCTAMWKGGGSEDKVPAHLVTANHAEFPWGSCTNMRVDY